MTSSLLESTDGIAALARLHREITGCTRCVAAGFIPAACPIIKGVIGNRVMVGGQAPVRYAHERPPPDSGRRWQTSNARVNIAAGPEAQQSSV